MSVDSSRFPVKYVFLFVAAAVAAVVEDIQQLLFISS